MLKQHKIALVILALGAAGVGTALAREAASPRHDPLEMGQNATTELLIIMDQYDQGKVSKAEFLKFMGAEFDRLDREKVGVVNIHQLKQAEDPSGQMTTFASGGK